MKRHLTLLLMVALGLSALAAPFKNIEIRLTQPDGKVINCYASGDEYYNYLHDANGFTIVRGDNGYYCYATQDRDGRVVATTYIVDSVDPVSVGLQPFVKISETEYYARRHEWEKHIQSPQMKNGREINHGRYNNLVVFIRFAGDTYHTTPFSTVQSMFNADGYEDVSLHNYYHHTSYNQIDLWSYFYPEPDGETVLSYEDIYPKQYYQPYDPVENPIGYNDENRTVREFDLLARAINYVEDMVPQDLELDYNGDGKVDNVVFVCKGETGAWNSLLWPHRWCIFDRTVMLHDLQVFDFNLQLEQGGYFNVSTLCHEMFHSLSAPDLYHYSGGGSPSGSWDLMCSTTEPPQQPNIYLKYKYGNWIDEIPVIDPSDPNAFGTYELEANVWEGRRRNAYMIPTPDPNQFFFVEYRDKRNIFEGDIPGSGLLIYRIDTRFDGNAGWNGVDYFDEVYLFRPGGTFSDDGEISLAHFSQERRRTTFNNDSDPYPFYSNGQTINWPYQITNVSATGDRISFDFRPYGDNGDSEGPSCFITHVNSFDHQVELTWDAEPNADSYTLYCDGQEIASGLTDTNFIHPYTEADNGYHTYSVKSIIGDLSSAPTSSWVILGGFETIDIELASDSPYGTKGGELEVNFSNPELGEQYFTIYEDRKNSGRIQVPSGTAVSFYWQPGFDPESQGIHIQVRKTNEEGQETIYDVDSPSEGLLGTYQVPEGHKGMMPPQHLTAVTDGDQIRMKWAIPVEMDNFKVYRDGMTCSSNIQGYEYLDSGMLRSGTYTYNVGSVINDMVAVDPNLNARALALNPYCEAPRLTGIHQDNANLLEWEAPGFAGYGMLAFDDNQLLEAIGGPKEKWGIIFDPEQLAHFGGQPLTHLEMFDVAEGIYKFKIYNGGVANSTTLVYSQDVAMTASGEWVRFALDEDVTYDASQPVWIRVESPNVYNTVPTCKYVGLDNSCLLISGSSWEPISDFDLYYSWMLRAYTRPQETLDSFTYNLYWCPDGASEDWTVLGMEGLDGTTVTHNTNEDLRYYVTAVWNNKETAFSNPVCLGPTVSVTETTTPDDEVFAYINNGNIIINNIDNKTTLQVVDVTGRIVMNVNAANHGIPTSKMAPGVYVLRIISGDHVKTQKIVLR